MIKKNSFLKNLVQKKNPEVKHVNRVLMVNTFPGLSIFETYELSPLKFLLTKSLRMSCLIYCFILTNIVRLKQRS